MEMGTHFSHFIFSITKKKANVCARAYAYILTANFVFFEKSCKLCQGCGRGRGDAACGALEQRHF